MRARLSVWRSAPRSLVAAHRLRTCGSSDVTKAAGIAFAHQNSATSNKYLIETMGGGVALLDYDNDGRLDVFLTNGAKIDDPMPAGKRPDKSDPAFWNRLYRQTPDGTFVDVTEKAGLTGMPQNRYGMGVAVGDYDNDGFDRSLRHELRRQHAVPQQRQRHVHRRDQPGRRRCRRLERERRVLRLRQRRQARSVRHALRGLELSEQPVLRREEARLRSYCHPDNYRRHDEHPVPQQRRRHVHRRVREGRHRRRRRARGSGVVVRRLRRRRLHRHLRRQRFGAVASCSTTTATARSPRSACSPASASTRTARRSPAWASTSRDYDNDGRPDIVVTDLSNERYMLFRQNADGSFRDVTNATGVGGATLPFSGWSTRFFDYDNDGWKDLFVAQGHVMDTIEKTAPNLKYLQPPLLLRNESARFVRVDAGDVFQQEWAGRGAAFGDLDNDGDIDIVLSNVGQNAVVLRNDGGNQKHWLQIRTVGTRSNRDGIGCRVKVVSASGPDTVLHGQYGRRLSLGERQAADRRSRSRCGRHAGRDPMAVGRRADIRERQGRADARRRPSRAMMTRRELLALLALSRAPVVRAGRLVARCQAAAARQALRAVRSRRASPTWRSRPG